eukprot:gnl/Chilomastix_caulleri/4470.p1 GENE.gnl/Chilomastix_caulleri/4470~~gnl/Chilomastix_caulleri/4470.p1  ORF type:complete len:57 (+),score=0.68 gnl/Chilomastix_caulleri/4470:37-207(+)
MSMNIIWRYLDVHMLWILGRVELLNMQSLFIINHIVNHIETIVMSRMTFCWLKYII